MNKDCDSKLLYDLLRTIRQKLNNQLRANNLSEFQKDLTIGEQQVIMVLSENKNTPIYMKDIASELDISPSTLTSIVDKLVEKGLVQRDFDLEDRRKIQISLTKKGEDIYKHLVDFRMKVLQPIFEKLSPQEIETLKSILQKIKEEL
ncbi:DNA-binding transcriptional regulator, MarR family [Thermoanaerobacter thermohydrosulfuricus]|jgi:DNA-binding MarR family transcriptional regulator|uniref:Transcriptional regulator n=4 Tax=Thermoanaerobacter TaxID=1754 RepID=I9KWL4_9THEO|nr:MULTISPECIES: MarR family transcriptional regulator [Thermoanaerobacter]EGD52213.1 regulatory protein MarR [Thermoanaerobacter ethanolicus JW 200]KUJ90498.1 MAG: regulatory protein MarR [Thermoanaerobacter thermocopriae]HAA64945.1 MarR family transcriptional regulator [Thermoanaerobacter sp.]AEM78600.1 regulatory protein MarR [Thermoanaerobacter wiegelii Rt8.B1]EIW01316.1 transcriptional regulator [Thermoanaerobacter siderophilus SR4]